MENFMLNGATMKINVDQYILNALKEDITSEDVTTNAKPKLLPYHVNWNECEKVVIATPIWARSYAAPINTFLQDNQEELRKKEISVYVGYRGNTGNTIDTIKENLQIDKLKSVLKLVDPLAKPSKEKEEEIMRFVQEIQK